MSNSQKNTNDKLIKAARNCQQNLFELLSDWNTYDQKKPQFLKNFIGIALFGPPKFEELNKLFPLKKQLDNELFFHDQYQETKINRIYDKIVQHGIQNTEKKEIMCGLIYNITFDKSIECGKYFTDEHVIKCLQPVPIFKVLKNIVKRNQNGNKITTKVAIYYIDDSERVYRNWTDYLNNNILSECFMIVPKAGEYQGDFKNQCWSSEKISYVSIEMYESPACKQKAINAIDSINKIVSLGCAGIGVAAAFNPIGATVMALGAVGMGFSGMWSVGRSSQKIVDRHLHDQSIGIKNRDGFVQWFGLASSILAVASSGGSVLLSNTLQNGISLSTAAKIAHGSVQMGSIAASGVNAGFMINNIYDSQEKRNNSTQDALNLVSNLLLFTNSAVDLQLAKNILSKNHTDLIQDFEHSLRNSRHRKEFCRMVKNSTSLSSTLNTPEQIIRSTLKISNKESLSDSIIKNKELFLFEGIEVVASNGSIIIDGHTLMKPLEFVEKLKENEKIQPITIGLTTNCSLSNNIFAKVLKNFLIRYKREFQDSQLSLTQFSSFLNNVKKIDNPDIIFSKLLLIGIKLMRKISNKNDIVKNFISEIVDFLWEYIQMNLQDRIGPFRQTESREFIMKIIFGIYSSVESNMEDWIDSLKYYLLINFKHLKQKINNSREGNLYLLKVM